MKKEWIYANYTTTEETKTLEDSLKNLAKLEMKKKIGCEAAEIESKIADAKNSIKKQLTSNHEESIVKFLAARKFTYNQAGKTARDQKDQKRENVMHSHYIATVYAEGVIKELVSGLEKRPFEKN